MIVFTAVIVTLFAVETNGLNCPDQGCFPGIAWTGQVSIAIAMMTAQLSIKDIDTGHVRKTVTYFSGACDSLCIDAPRKPE
ncbi:MAG: hypothetical protein WD772_05180 [Pseudohongiellaceae bacterium]